MDDEMTRTGCWRRVAACRRRSGSPRCWRKDRYPEVRPAHLRELLAHYYGCDPANLLVTRGSSEAIDLLMRVFCEAGRDNVVTTAPTFSMYEHYAIVQGAILRQVEADRDRDFRVDANEILAACDDSTKLIFLCSPNNPTGNSVTTDQLILLATLLSGRALVVVDAAYAEFGDESQTAALLETPDNDNIVVLRTLSKAFGLAGARCGALLGPPNIVSMLGCVMPPYAISTPVTNAVAACLTPDAKAEVAKRCEFLRTERDRLAAELDQLPGIEEVYPSDANFLLVRVADADRAQQLAEDGGVLIRNFGGQLPGCLRITVGEADENNRLIEALAKL